MLYIYAIERFCGNTTKSVGYVIYGMLLIAVL